MRLERSRLAQADLDDILIYSLDRFGETVARDYFFSFTDAFGLIERHPYVGEAVVDIQSSMRRLKHRQHHIYYEVVNDRIVVIRVLHHAMSPEGKF